MIGTGNTPREKVEAMKERRDVFWDAPLEKVKEANVTREVSVFASVSLRLAVGGEVEGDGMSEKQLEIVKGQVEEAKTLGVKARYWDTPGWPKSRRVGVWKQLMGLGVGLVNVDEIEEAVELL